MTARKLPYIVQYRDSTHPYWEDIAAFNCEPVAVNYAGQCAADNIDQTDGFERRWRAIKYRPGKPPIVLSQIFKIVE